ncbi:MAG: serine/threonine protein kinase [Xanthobacteraceae bacterium]|nr:MAG: serine/threonine protein kinase [Xanthobacteraceae bacterium]
MDLPRRDAAVLAPLWTEGVLLKRDVFSTVERGRFRTPHGEVDAVLRRLDQVPWWSRVVARHLFARERRALAKAGPQGLSTPLLWAGRDCLVRGWIDGVALHLARPYGDRAYFAAAKALLSRLHRAGICHNDLAKEQNWLRGNDGLPYLTDFQLAMRFRRRSLLFRVAAYEDLRHLLKHKRKYIPDALTPMERKVLARKAALTTIWMATGKKVYIRVTRGLFRFTDREGGGPRLVTDAPRFIAALKTNPAVRDAAIVAYPDRRAGIGLYAFVERQASHDGSGLEAELRKLLGAGTAATPEHVQVVDELPRDGAGQVRTELLQLIATNQIDPIASLIHSPGEDAVVRRILAGRKNLTDRRLA